MEVLCGKCCRGMLDMDAEIGIYKIVQEEMLDQGQGMKTSDRAVM